MYLQTASMLDAAVLLGSGVGAALTLGLRTVRRTPASHPVPVVPAER